MKSKVFLIPLSIVIIFFIGFGIAKISNAPDRVIIKEEIIEVVEKPEILDKSPAIQEIRKPKEQGIASNAIQKKMNNNLQAEIKNSTKGFLEMFSFAPPEMTEENINRHNDFIESLNKDPIASLQHFKEVLSLTQDDGERGNIINLVNKLNLNKKEKADFYSTYIEELEIGTNGDVIDDNSLSTLIAIDYLNENVPPEEIASYIQQSIQGKSGVVRETILDRFSAYYPEIVREFR